MPVTGTVERWGIGCLRESVAKFSKCSLCPPPGVSVNQNGRRSDHHDHQGNLLAISMETLPFCPWICFYFILRACHRCHDSNESFLGQRPLQQKDARVSVQRASPIWQVVVCSTRMGSMGWGESQWSLKSPSCTKNSTEKAALALKWMQLNHQAWPNIPNFTKKTLFLKISWNHHRGPTIGQRVGGEVWEKRAWTNSPTLL